MSKVQTAKYTLDEVLAINEMLDVDGLSLKEIATITASSPLVPTRTVHALRYKFKEGAITDKDKGTKVTRSLQRFSTNEELFNHFKVPFVSEEDVVARITNYRSQLVVSDSETTTA